MSNTTLRILQYNVNHGKDATLVPLLHDTRVHEFDILAIQEPWRNPFTTTSYNPQDSPFYLAYHQSPSPEYASTSIRGSTQIPGQSHITARTHRLLRSGTDRTNTRERSRCTTSTTQAQAHTPLRTRGRSKPFATVYKCPQTIT